MEKLIYDEQEELASREINNKLILFVSSVTAPFTLGSSLELGILLTTAGTAYFDSRFQSVQQTEGLEEYQSQESFRNAWNMVYNTVQIADMVIGVAGTAYTLNELYKLYREMRYMESASKLVKNDFVLLLRGSEGVVNQAGKFTLQQIDDYVAMATKQGNQSKVMLGKFEPNSPNSYISRAGNDHAYFDMGPTNWSKAESIVGGSVDEMWKINKKFIDNRKALGNDFYLSHDPTNPAYYKGFYKMEIDYLTMPVSQGGLGGTMNNLGNNLWKVTW